MKSGQLMVKKIAVFFDVCAVKPWVMRTLLLAAFVLYLGFAASVVLQNKQVDFNLYYIAASGFAHGKDVYGADGALWEAMARDAGIVNYAPPYRYPPLTALLVWPLTFVSPLLAVAIWFVATTLAFLAAAWLIGSPLSSPRGKPLALVLALGYVPLLTTISNGQVNGFVLLGLALSFWGLMKGSGKRLELFTSGVGVAVGAMLKLVPLAHLFFLAWRRRWVQFAIGLAALLVLILVSLPLVKLADLESYSRHFFSLGETGNLVPIGANQALNGFFSRVFMGKVSPHWITLASIVSSLLLVAATAALSWPSRPRARRLTNTLDDARSTTIGLEFALITVVVNLITPYAWYHQYSLILLPIIVLADRAIASSNESWIILPLFLCYFIIDVRGLAWHHFEGKPLLLSLPLFAALTIWALLAYLVINDKRRSRLGWTSEDH